MILGHVARKNSTNHYSKIYLPGNRDRRLGQLGPSSMTLIDLLRWYIEPSIETFNVGVACHRLNRVL